MGTYYYVDDPSEEWGYLPVHEDDYVAAIEAIAEKHGLKITDEMILDEVESVRKEESGKKD